MSTSPNNQLRKHLPPDWLLSTRRLFQLWRGVRISPEAVLFSGVKLLRFPKNIKIGESALLKSGAHLCPCNSESRVSVGARTSIGFHTLIYASSSISIGSDCMIAPFVYIVDSNHGIEKGIPMNQQDNIARPIVIGDDVWIGAHAVVLPGVSVGNGAVIAAGAVVKEDVGENMIVGGVPARTIGARK